MNSMAASRANILQIFLMGYIVRVCSEKSHYERGRIKNLWQGFDPIKLWKRVKYSMSGIASVPGVGPKVSRDHSALGSRRKARHRVWEIKGKSEHTGGKNGSQVCLNISSLHAGDLQKLEPLSTELLTHLAQDSEKLKEELMQVLAVTLPTSEPAHSVCMNRHRAWRPTLTFGV